MCNFVSSGYSHHLGDGVQQLSELTNGGSSSNGTASGPPSGSGAGSGDENGYVPQGYDADQDYHSISDNNTHPGYVENSPEFYSPSLLDKAFQPQTTFINKSFSRSKSIIFPKRNLVFFQDLTTCCAYAYTGGPGSARVFRALRDKYVAVELPGNN